MPEKAGAGMNRKKTLITWAILLAVEAAIVLVVAGFELGSRGGGAAPLMQSLSDGFFTAAVLVIGCGLLVCIQDAGNFYGMQFLVHTLTRRLFPNRECGNSKMTYFDYCMEKRERRAAEGKSPVKPAMLLSGLGCLALALLFTALFYKL